MSNIKVMSYKSHNDVEKITAVILYFYNENKIFYGD